MNWRGKRNNLDLIDDHRDRCVDLKLIWHSNLNEMLLGVEL